MSTAVQSRASIINPADHIVDLVRREIDAIGRGAADLLTKKTKQDQAVKAGASSAAHALAKIQHVYAPVLSKAPIQSAGAGAALSTLRSSVSMTGPVMRKALQVVGMDDPGSPGNDAETGGAANAGLGNGAGAADAVVEVVDTFNQYDPATQATAADFYDVNAAGMVDGLFASERDGLRQTLDDLFRNTGADAGEAGAAAANNAANNLGTAVGVAIGALVGGPIGAAIGAFVGAAVFAFARNVVDRMLAAFDDLWNEIFG